MVFIQSQEYTDAFGKKSKNVLCLEGQTDYKLSLNEESGKYEVCIIIGDYEKYIFTADTEKDCTKILQNIFNHHATKDPTIIYDVNAFMIPEVKQETTLEEIEDMMASLLEFHGYKGLVEAWETKLAEDYTKSLVEADETSPLKVNDVDELFVDPPSNRLHPTTAMINQHAYCPYS
jgi:hypothetical protein